MKTKKQLVIFDLGGVVVDVESDRLMHQIAQMAGLSIDDVQDIVYHKTLLKEFELGRLKPSEYFYGLKEKLHLPWTFEQFQQFWNDILIEKKDTTAVISRLKGRCKLSVLSNTNTLHLDHMKAKVSVLAGFDDIIGSFAVGMVKPDPEIYKLALKRAGVAAEAAVYVDDRPEMIEGGKGVGLHAIRFESASQLERELRAVGLLD